jgi:hypothetical protein
MENNKIIFLDIDGVLNVNFPSHDEYGRVFHPHFVENLRYIIEKTQAKIVISSTWRFSGLVIMKEMWEKRNLPGEVIDITPHIDICKRGEEIEYWLKNNEVDSYVIVDDDNDMLESQQENFIKTSGNISHEDNINNGMGLTLKCAEKAINILNNITTSPEKTVIL